MPHPLGALPQLLQQQETAVAQHEIRQRHRHALRRPAQPRQHGAQPDGAVQQQVEGLGPAAAEVALHEDRHRVVEGVHVVHRPLARALSLVVYDVGGGHVVVLPPCQPYAPRVVYVLAVHEVALVEPPDPVVHLAPQHEEGARHDLYLVHLVVAQVAHIVGRYTAVVREEVYQAADFVERRLRRGEATLALFQVAPFAVDHLHRQAPAVTMRRHEVGAPHKRVGLHHGVRVEQEQQLPAVCRRSAGRYVPKGLVVGLGKARVVVVGNHVHLRIVASHHLDTPVHRVVVHNPHVQLHRAPVGQLPLRAEHGRQALLQEVLDVIVYYDYRDNHPLLLALTSYGSSSWPICL